MQIARSSALKEFSRPLAWLEQVGPAGTADDSMKRGSWSRLYELLYHQRQSAIQRLQQLSVQVDDKRLLRCMERGLQAVRPMAGTVNRGAASLLAHRAPTEPYCCASSWSASIDLLQGQTPGRDRCSCSVIVMGDQHDNSFSQTFVMLSQLPAAPLDRDERDACFCFEYSIICNTTPTQHSVHKKTKPLMTGLVFLGAQGVSSLTGTSLFSVALHHVCSMT